MENTEKALYVEQLKKVRGILSILSKIDSDYAEKLDNELSTTTKLRFSHEINLERMVSAMSNIYVKAYGYIYKKNLNRK
jgi:hypothetical protein